MTRPWSPGRREAVAFALVASVLQWGVAQAVPVDESGKKAGPGVASESMTLTPPSPTSDAIAEALRRGRWSRACSAATDALGRQEQNLDALGTFGMCAALAKDEAAVATTLKRLKDAEPPPRYFAAMTEGILQLRKQDAGRAEATFKSVLDMRADDPLALYFTGEAQHQLKRDPQALQSFNAVLKKWPEYAPALAASARLLATPNASQEQLKKAVALNERATAIEPMNLDYWKQMADLYDRVGQKDRAAAVRLQWLNPPKAK